MQTQYQNIHSARCRIFRLKPVMTALNFFFHLDNLFRQHLNVHIYKSNFYFKVIFIRTKIDERIFELSEAKKWSLDWKCSGVEVLYKCHLTQHPPKCSFTHYIFDHLARIERWELEETSEIIFPNKIWKINVLYFSFKKKSFGFRCAQYPIQ